MGVLVPFGLMGGYLLAGLQCSRLKFYERQGHCKHALTTQTKLWSVQSHAYPAMIWHRYGGRQAMLSRWTGLQVMQMIAASNLLFFLSSVGLKAKESRNHKPICRGNHFLHAVHNMQESQRTEEIEEEQEFDVLNKYSKVGSGEDNDVERESLNFLDWFSICEQVARFASTPMGGDAAKKGRLVIGGDQKQSELLLDQTEAAYFLSTSLDFSGITDVQDILKSALSGAICTVKELCTLQTLLLSARKLYDEVQGATNTVPVGRDMALFGSDNVLNNDLNSQGNHTFSPLLSILTKVNFCSSLEQDLTYCLDNFSLSILDRASPNLASIRSNRRDNMRALESLLLEIARKVVEAGGMDSILVTQRRARLCVAVRTSHRSLIPNGVVLDVSNSGATLFMEPRPALELNNNEVQLASLEKAEEESILERLSSRLAVNSENILTLLRRITLLDLACARAKHAKWLGSVKPFFVARDGKSSKPRSDEKGHGVKGSINNAATHLIHLDGICHPLLLGSALSKAGVNYSEFEDAKNIDSSEQNKLKLPVPIDLKVKWGVNVVVISGPNTGGKTATMKTLGVAALMANAGLFLPAKGQAFLPWFDKVLADIGDEQSLEQSLSTFSGHMQRLCKILAAGSNQSLVLLDEIGSGTDPSEGAALASAVLQHLAANVLLTIATTHYAELSNLKQKDMRFEVASLEFDIKTLLPTYNMQWGTVGQSNALNIASSLGFDEKVLARARYWMTKLGRQGDGEGAAMLMAPLMEQLGKLQQRAEAAVCLLSEAKYLHDELLIEVEDLEKREAALRLQQEEAVTRDITIAKSRMDEIVAIYERSLDNFYGEGERMSMRNAQASIASIVEEFTEKFGDLSRVIEGMEIEEVPSVGDLVCIRSLGNKLAKVVEAPTRDGDTLMVQHGSMKLRVRLSEVISMVKRGKEHDRVSSNHSSKGQNAPESTNSSFEAAIRTSRNTVDLRGMRADDALRELDFAIARKGPMSVLFVVHGVGTGAVKEAVLLRLKKHPSVAKFEQENPMNGGCTLVYIK